MSDPIKKAAQELIAQGDIVIKQHNDACMLLAKIVGEDHEYYRAYGRLVKAVKDSDEKQKT